MGNSQDTDTQHTITAETEYIPTESSAIPSKGLTINFPEIDKKFSIGLSSSNISFEAFCKEFETDIKLPNDTKLRYYHINSLTEATELLENDYIVSNLNKEIYVEIIELGNIAKVIDITLTLIKGNEMKLISTKIFNFMPLKYSLMFQSKNEGNFRVFRPDDTMLTNPLNLDLSIKELEIEEEDCILTLYYPSSNEIIKVTILDRDGINIFEVDKYMRISQLNDFYNKVKHRCMVICDKSTGMKIYQNYLLYQLLQNDAKKISFNGFLFDEYFKKPLETKRVNPLEREETKTNFLDLPD